MSIGLKRNWRAGDDWRKLAFLYYRNSLAYSTVLKLNSSYDIRFVPAPGTEVVATGLLSGKNGLSESSLSTTGLLEQADATIDLTSNAGSAQNFPTSTEQSIFPWDSFSGYADRLGEYTAAALLNQSRVNGYALDSPEAIATPLSEPDLVPKRDTAFR